MADEHTPATDAGDDGAAAIDILFDGLMERHTSDDGTPYLKCLSCTFPSLVGPPAEQRHHPGCPVTMAVLALARAHVAGGRGEAPADAFIEIRCRRHPHPMTADEFRDVCCLAHADIRRAATGGATGVGR